jgi:diaminopimelate epimerase
MGDIPAPAGKRRRKTPTPPASIVGMRFAKGQGTGNDFVILPDPDGKIELTPELVRRLCDRRFGIGGDGVLRVVRSAVAWQAGADPGAEWFMDYRNADGSVAEMCGNGVRVFVKYLIEEGLANGPSIEVATRAGIRAVRAEPNGQFTVNMGAATVLGSGSVEVADRTLAGLAISIGNPHVACMIDEPVADVDLCSPRVLAPDELAGRANVEIVRAVGPREIEMRVHERGSGLTLSCGTGAVAAAVAAAAAVGEWPDGPGLPWTVCVPGGRLAVLPSGTASLLTGPAEIVAVGELSASWLADLSPVGLGTS